MAEGSAALTRSAVYGLRSTVVLLCVALAGAQEPAPQPRFATKAELVLVDVSVLDRDGRPVADLTAQDFELIVNGTPRPVHTAQFISTETTRASAAATNTAPASGASSKPAVPTTGRFLLFAVDENYLRVGAGHEVIKRATGILDTLAPGDQAAFARLPGGSGGVEFTTTREPIREALGRIMGKQPNQQFERVSLAEAAAFTSGGTSAREEVIKRACGFADGMALTLCLQQVEADAKSAIYHGNQRTDNSIRALEQLLERLAPLRTPINLVLFSEGLFLNRDRHDLRRLSRLAADARVTFHIIQIDLSNFDRDKPEILSANAPSILGEGLEQIAGSSGGTVYRVSTSGAGILDRIARELSGYYLLSFEPSDADRKSSDRRIRVQVRRRGLEVRARSTYALAEKEATPAAPATPREKLNELLASTVAATGVSIRVATFALPDAQTGRVRVILSAEIGESGTDVNGWSLGLVVRDQDGKRVIESAPPATPLLVQSMALAAGQYTIRMAAIAPDGQAGSVDHTLHATLLPLTTDGSVSASDLIVANETAGGAMRPTPSGAIETDNVAMVVELAGSDANLLDNAKVMIEIAASNLGPALVKSVAQPIPRANASQRAFGAAVNIAALAPREYVARAIVAIPGHPDTAITRTFIRVAR